MAIFVKNKSMESIGNGLGVEVPKTEKKHPEAVDAAVPPPDELLIAPPEQPYRPWLVPGRDAL
jgi:hypothetical protein